FIFVMRLRDGTGRSRRNTDVTVRLEVDHPLVDGGGVGGVTVVSGACRPDHILTGVLGGAFGEGRLLRGVQADNLLLPVGFESLKIGTGLKTGRNNCDTDGIAKLLLGGESPDDKRIIRDRL